MQPKISIIIVTWNALNFLEKCLASIDKEADVPYELFIADNNTTLDDTKNFLKSYKPTNTNCVHFKYVLNGGDYGFSVAVNQGMRKARGEYVLLLNPDTEMKPNTLSELISVSERYPNLGAMGVKILNPDMSLQHCVSQFPSLFNIVGGRLRLKKRFPKNNFIQKKLEVNFDPEKESVVESVKGALFFIKKEALDKVGLFDEGFFLWFEETDFCKRVINAGYDLLYSPQITVIHQGGTGIAQMSFRERQTIYNKSLRRYFRKHHGILKSWLAGIVDPLCTVLAMTIFKK